MCIIFTKATKQLQTASSSSSLSSFSSLSFPYSSNSYSPSICFSSSPSSSSFYSFSYSSVSSSSFSFPSSTLPPSSHHPLGEISIHFQLYVEILDVYIFGTDRPTDRRTDRPTGKASYRNSLPELQKGAKSAIQQVLNTQKDVSGTHSFKVIHL